MCIIINKSRRYLSWIEGLTTNQNVIGSNPIRRTNCSVGEHIRVFVVRRAFVLLVE